MPPAPPTFSTITCCCKASLKADCRIRATASIGPPAANGTTIVSGRIGQVSASIGVAKIASRAIRTSRSILGSRGVSSQLCVDLVYRDIGLKRDLAVSGDFALDEFHVVVAAQWRAGNPERLQLVQKRRVSVDFRELSAQAVDHFLGKTGWSRQSKPQAAENGRVTCFRHRLGVRPHRRAG